MKIVLLTITFLTSVVCEASMSHRDDFVKSSNLFAQANSMHWQDCHHRKEKSLFKFSSTIDSSEKLRRDSFSTYNYCTFVKSFK